MMVASIDNPSNAIEWAIGEMINQPETLAKAVQELDQVVGKNRLVQESDLNNLSYIQACVKESFRLHPITAFNVPHVSMCDTIVAGYFIPKGSHVLLSRPGLGRNFKIWDEPMRFNPQRHLKHDGSNVILSDPDLHLLSFSIGRRGCPAVNLGSTMSVMLLASLLQGFTWSPPPKTTCIELVESIDEMVLSKPLLAFARPRLDERLYASLNPYCNPNVTLLTAVEDHADNPPAQAELNDFEDAVMSNEENPSDHVEQNDLDVAVLPNEAPSPPVQPKSVEDVREDIEDESLLVEQEDVEAVFQHSQANDVWYEGAPGNITRELLRSMKMGREISSEVIDACMMPRYFPNPLKKT
ncbi:phenylalanine N-monooxygenase CYP79D16-like [Impatiens glandulifera]|uniref:phenylalanine N-monooxygenase CYP79D16-like n=1 Tax=Impatiens glandulifera TaxID=253017 RepID=UPI001FB17ABA|nr:phenylalanine N-monooxygenase CYP79D16-like [Impatiens glandulifera]